MRRGDPEDVLLSLGFGGGLPSDDVIASILNRIPPRFQGIDVIALLNSLKLSSRLKDGVYGVPHHFQVRVDVDGKDNAASNPKLKRQSKLISVGDYVDLKQKGI